MKKKLRKTNFSY